MAEEIELQKLKEEYPDFFRKTPPEIIDFVLSKQTAKQITNICGENGVADEEKIEEIAQRIAWVLLGKLPSGNLATTLELWVKLTPEIAKKIADEANQFISSVMAHPEKKLPEETTAPAYAEAPTGKEEKPKRPPSKDTYREPVE